ncbi:MAG TPA: 2-oxoglutarate dehydrogenase complex dihydrolipoyllysine-residue succinyltransferase [Steroidobacteraceae bacterium]|jgi:2-oxoglutarate dehydrogenase E2 component (dihydrolipoamide succinyltransferase)|nr:2-oxoglutarate dehydrogenase complex dihydrolipoyllysine-residue succinyltransferase [Steroidobacteraceae bacterium]
MSTEIRVPQLPESVADATLVAWHKQPGESIRRDENLADLETDKVVLEVPAPANGVVREIRVKSGTVVTSGQLLAVIDEGDVTATMPVKISPAVVAAARAASQAAAAQAAGEPALEAPARAAAPAKAGAPGADNEAAREAGKLSPSVRRLVEENRLDPAAIPASGRDGRLTKSDVVGFLDKRPASVVAPAPATAPPPASPAAPAAAAAAAPAPAPAARPAAPAAARTASGRSEQRVPMTRLRARIAQRLLEAQSTQALLTSFNEVDLTEVQALRARYKDRFEKQNGVKLGFMSFFVKACIEALKKFPVVNASVDGSDIIYHEYYDIGVAVSTDRGLVVPIVRDADTKSFAQIEKEVADYARKARDGTIAIGDLTGGTFTITNGGVFGSLMSTPIVNAPQSAILGMHKIQERPMVVDGQIAVRPMMYLAVTYDHRIIDGRDAVQFLVAVKEALEDPGRMLLGI